MIVTFLFALEHCYHVYDGFIFPSESWWNKIADFIMATGINTKDSFGYALTIHLQSVKISMSSLIHYGTGNISKNVCSIYFKLRQKKFLHFDDIKKVTHFSCADQLDKALQNVSI